MTGLEVLLAVAGLVATALVVGGMILLTPRGTVEPRRTPSPAPPRTMEDRLATAERAVADR
jgi:hypothetical protein